MAEFNWKDVLAVNRMKHESNPLDDCRLNDIES
jgi:hypothetical protein